MTKIGKFEFHDSCKLNRSQILRFSLEKAKELAMYDHVIVKAVAILDQHDSEDFFGTNVEVYEIQAYGELLCTYCRGTGQHLCPDVAEPVLVPCSSKNCNVRKK